MNLTFALILLSLTVFIITGIILSKMREGTLTTLLGIFIYATFFIGPIIFFQFYTYDDYHKIEKHDWYIESLGNDKSLNGSFFLGSGSVNEIDYYYFYVNTTDGLSRLRRRVSKTYIIETDDRKPELVIIYDHYDDDDKFWTVADDTELHYRLYVPKGTIIRDFSVR